tara:strand:- start:69 stop:344 length:276 start_codon:yes stop_codon:yes gene_type:complete
LLILENESKILNGLSHRNGQKIIVKVIVKVKKIRTVNESLIFFLLKFSIEKKKINKNGIIKPITLVPIVIDKKNENKNKFKKFFLIKKLIK